MSVSLTSSARQIFQRVPYLFLIFFIVYSFEINNFDLSIDDERHAISSDDFIPLGRWLFPVLQATVWPQLVAPHAALLVFGALISCSFCLVLLMFRQETFRAEHYLCFAVFVSFPAMLAQLEFGAHVVPLGISFLACSLAAYLTLDAFSQALPRFWLYLGASALLCALAAGAYQASILNYFVLVVPAIAFRAFVRREISLPGSMRAYLAAGAVLIVGTVLYGLIATLFWLMSGIEPASEYIAAHYLDEGQTVTLLGDLTARVKSLLQGSYRTYYGWWYSFGIAPYVYAGSLLFCAVVILLRGSVAPVARVVMAGALAAMVLAPGALALVSGQSMPLRTFVASPAVYLVLFLIAFSLWERGPVRTLLLALGAAFVVQSLYIQSMQQARAWVTQRHDLALAAALELDIQRAIGGVAGPDQLLDFHGSRATGNPYPIVPTTTKGESFFAWDGGNAFRMVRFMNMTGFDAYEPVPGAQREAFADDYAAMPVWPAPGAIRRVDGAILVKLSD